MSLTLPASFVAAFLFALRLLFIMGNQSQQPWLHDELALRNATEADLDDIVRIVQAGFPDDPEVGYRFPLRDEYPEDYWKWTRIEYRGYIQQPNKFVVHLVEAPVMSHDGKVVMRPAAVAVWDVAVLTEDKKAGMLIRYINFAFVLNYARTDQGLDERRDANKKHCLVYNEVIATCFKKYFQKYKEKQIHLWIVVTHPDFRRRGAGTMLTSWGIEAAEERDWPVTVFASPMGQLLYAYLNFEKIATEYIQAEGEEEKLTFSVMEYKEKKEIDPQKGL